MASSWFFSLLNFLYIFKFWFLTKYLITVSKQVLLFSAFCDAGYTYIKFSVCSKISYLICFCKNSKKIYHQQSVIVVTLFHSFLTAACICCCPYWKLGSEGIWNVNALFSKNDSSMHISCCKPQGKQWLWRPSNSFCRMVSVVLVCDD